MVNRDIAKFRRPTPACAGPGAESGQGPVVITGFVSAKSEKAIGRAAMAWTRKKVFERRSRLGKPVLLVKESP